MGIKMRISPVSFYSKSPKINNRQDFDELRDKALDDKLRELLPMFMNGDADVVFISTTVTPDRDLNMDVRVEKMETLKHQEPVPKEKETLLDKIKKHLKSNNGR